MSYIMKRRDVLVRPDSKISKQGIYDYLDKRLPELEGEDENGDYAYYYATVFDSRTHEFFYYYSKGCAKHYKLGKQLFEVITVDFVTKKNFMKVFVDNIKDIVTSLKTYFNVGAYKIKSCVTKVDKDNKIKLDGIKGDIINNSVFVKIDSKNNVYEERMVNLNEDGEIIFDDNLVGKEVISSYLIKDTEKI